MDSLPRLSRVITVIVTLSPSVVGASLASASTFEVQEAVATALPATCTGGLLRGRKSIYCAAATARHAMRATMREVKLDFTSSDAAANAVRVLSGATFGIRCLAGATVPCRASACVMDVPAVPLNGTFRAFIIRGLPTRWFDISIPRGLLAAECSSSSTLYKWITCALTGVVAVEALLSDASQSEDDTAAAAANLGWLAGLGGISVPGNASADVGASASLTFDISVRFASAAAAAIAAALLHDAVLTMEGAALIVRIHLSPCADAFWSSDAVRQRRASRDAAERRRIDAMNAVAARFAAWTADGAAAAIASVTLRNTTKAVQGLIKIATKLLGPDAPTLALLPRKTPTPKITGTDADSEPEVVSQLVSATTPEWGGELLLMREVTGGRRGSGSLSTANCNDEDKSNTGEADFQRTQLLFSPGDELSVPQNWVAAAAEVMRANAGAAECAAAEAFAALTAVADLSRSIASGIRTEAVADGPLGRSLDEATQSAKLAGATACAALAAAATSASALIDAVGLAAMGAWLHVLKREISIVRTELDAADETASDASRGGLAWRCPCGMVNSCCGVSCHVTDADSHESGKEKVKEQENARDVSLLGSIRDRYHNVMATLLAGEEAVSRETEYILSANPALHNTLAVESPRIRIPDHGSAALGPLRKRVNERSPLVTGSRKRQIMLKEHAESFVSNRGDVASLQDVVTAEWGILLQKMLEGTTAVVESASSRAHTAATAFRRWAGECAAMKATARALFARVRLERCIVARLKMDQPAAVLDAVATELARIAQDEVNPALHVTGVRNHSLIHTLRGCVHDELMFLLGLRAAPIAIAEAFVQDERVATLLELGSVAQAAGLAEDDVSAYELANACITNAGMSLSSIRFRAAEIATAATVSAAWPCAGVDRTKLRSQNADDLARAVSDFAALLRRIQSFGSASNDLYYELCASLRALLSDALVPILHVDCENLAVSTASWLRSTVVELGDRLETIQVQASLWSKAQAVRATLRDVFASLKLDDVLAEEYAADYAANFAKAKIELRTTLETSLAELSSLQFDGDKSRTARLADSIEELTTRSGLAQTALTILRELAGGLNDARRVHPAVHDVDAELASITSAVESSNAAAFAAASTTATLMRSADDETAVVRIKAAQEQMHVRVTDVVPRVVAAIGAVCAMMTCDRPAQLAVATTAVRVALAAVAQALLSVDAIRLQIRALREARTSRRKEVLQMALLRAKALGSVPRRRDTEAPDGRRQ